MNDSNNNPANTQGSFTGIRPVGDKINGRKPPANPIIGQARADKWDNDLRDIKMAARTVVGDVTNIGEQQIQIYAALRGLVGEQRSLKTLLILNLFGTAAIFALILSYIILN